MDLERTHAVALVLQAELGPIVQELGAAASQGDEEEARARVELAVELAASAPSNELPPTQHHLVQGLGGASVTGAALAHRLRAASEEFSGAAWTAVMGELRKEVAGFGNNLAGLVNALTKLGVQATSVPRGETEIGVRFPGEYGLKDLSDLRDEVAELNKHLNSIGEASTGEPPRSPRIRGTATGSPDINIFVDLHPIAAAAFAWGIAKVTHQLKTILEIATLWRDLKERDYGGAAAEVLGQEGDKLKEQGKEEIVEGLLARCSADASRKRELKQLLRMAVDYIFDRAERGVQFEVTTGQVEEGDREKLPHWSELRLIKSEGNSMRQLRGPGHAIGEIAEVGEGEAAWEEKARQHLEVLEVAAKAGDQQRVAAQLSELRRLEELKPMNATIRRMLAAGLGSYLRHWPEENRRQELEELVEQHPEEDELCEELKRIDDPGGEGSE